MVAKHADSAGTNVVRLPSRRAGDLVDHAAAVRAFLTVGLGRVNRPSRPGVRGRGSRDRGGARRPALELPCQRHDPNLWFAEAPADLDRAKALCAQCPIRLACLAVAIDNAEFAGVWGGHIFDRGQIVAHKRPRGRPRKHQTQHAASAEHAVGAPADLVPSHNVPAALHHGPAAVRAAADRLYAAECALHSAHQSHVDAWVDAANRKLHAAVTDYLAVATRSELPARTDLAG
jgi:WhiB family transcriptional regulator, redox-sensing transcriptional regulator